jgi:hypothetical protein
MPWSINDVDKFRSGLERDQKTKWVAIANNVLELCVKKGGDVLECESNAVKSANSKFIQYSFADDKKLQTAPVNKNVSDWQLVLSVGLWQTMKYGEIIITKTLCEKLYENWKNKIFNEREPFLDVNHDRGEAQAWVEDMRCTDDGLEIKWRWTSPGKEKVEGELYRQYSADFGSAKNIKTGEIVYPVLYGVALTNNPVLNTLPKATLSEISDAELKKEKLQGKKMTIEDVIKFINDPARNQEEKDAIMKAIGIEPKEDAKEDSQTLEAKKVAAYAKTEKEKIAMSESDMVVFEALKDQVKTLSERLAKEDEAKKNSVKSSVIGLALSEGRIKPVDKEKWEKRYDSNPEEIGKILSELPKDPNFKVEGIAKGEMSKASLFNDDDIKLAVQMGLTKEEMLEMGKKE